uniref:Uncharacterized protein n=1 Tax=Glossina pallidipes TaxID=7398 RepID=A0A1A9ZPR8_GLOPL
MLIRYSQHRTDLPKRTRAFVCLHSLSTIPISLTPYLTLLMTIKTDFVFFTQVDFDGNCHCELTLLSKVVISSHEMCDETIDKPRKSAMKPLKTAQLLSKYGFEFD